MKRDIRTLAVTVVGLVTAALIAVAAGIHFEHTKGVMPRPGSLTPRHHPPLSYLGVYEPTAPGSYSGVEQFARLVGHRPNIAVYYSSWWEPFQLGFARAAHAHDALPMVQIEPSGVSLAAIAAGQYDSYLRAYARAVRAYGHPAILSFGHEMNADWYSWGYRHTPPAVFVAAWRHIHRQFTGVGARHVIWLWTVNVVGGPQVRAIRPWWPGAAYVTWVGIDGHYFQRSIRFPGLFGATLDQIRGLTRDRVLIAESGIAPFIGPTRISDLFAGAQAHDVAGVVWFDVSGHNLRVEGHPAAIAAFRRAVREHVKRPAPGNGKHASATSHQGGSR